MIVECSNCHKRYKVADDKIPFEGKNIKCPNCQSSIFVKRPIELIKDGQDTIKPEVKCPKCGSTDIMDDECRSCGVFISKYLKLQEKMVRSESHVPPQEPPAQALHQAPLSDKKPTLSPGREIFQSRAAIITAAVLFIINALLNLFSIKYDPSNARIIIISSVIDIVVAAGLLLDKKTYRNWALVRVVLGMIVWGGVALYQSANFQFFAQVVLSTSFIILLTGAGTKARIALGIGIFILAYIALILFGPSELDMLRENIVYSGSNKITSKQYPYSITMPSAKWNQLKEHTLNEVSDIEMFIEEPEAYCITILEPTNGYSLHEMKTAIIQNTREVIDLKVVEEKEIMLNSYKAVQMVQTSRIEGMDFKYLHVIIVGKGYCYQIICWTFKDDFQKSLSDFNKIVNSFTIK